MMVYIVLTVVFSVVGMVVSGRLKSKFAHYSQFMLRNGMSGREVAEAMLRHYNISDVEVEEHAGFLSDHYDPLHKRVRLSPDVFHGRSISAAAVAAHECGHAVQHANAYVWLQFRSAIVPVVSVAANLQQYLLMAALGMFGFNGNSTILLITIAAFAITTFFSVVTLPVEFDASRRALVWLDQSGVARNAEYDGAKDALWWAAMTYVVAALAAFATLLYLIMRYMGANRD